MGLKHREVWVLEALPADTLEQPLPSTREITQLLHYPHFSL